MVEKCKHDFGWSSYQGYHVFITDKNEVTVNFGKWIKTECNRRCGKLKKFRINKVKMVKKHGR